MESSDTPFDVIVVGSGAGGCAAVHNLVKAGLSVLLLEKGAELPRDGSTLDVRQVIGAGLFKSSEEWRDRHGRRFAPEEYFNVGGKTKWYGAALLRYGRHEFESETGHQCAGWPISYDDLSAYYAQAERLLAVRDFEVEPDLRRIAGELTAALPEWSSEPLPLGLAPQILNDPWQAAHFDGFASPDGLKSDAEGVFLEPVRLRSNLRIRLRCTVRNLIPAAGDPTSVGGVRLADGSVVRARAVVLAAGALHSPRLLEAFIRAQRLESQVPCHVNVGRRLKMHLLTAMVAVSSTRKTDLIRKTRLFLNENLPHSSVQPLGFDGQLIANLIPKWVPRSIAGAVGARSYGFFLQTEDGSHPDNRVYDAPGSNSPGPVLDYDPKRSPAALREHLDLVRRFRRGMFRIGLLAFSERIGLAGTAHVSGTLAAGTSPADSVVDATGAVHGLRGIYVADGSVLPRSSRVNPSLSIYAWSLRLAEKLAEKLAEGRGAARAGRDEPAVGAGGT